MQNNPTIQLKAGREKSVKHFHPWIFSGSVELVKGDPQPGETVIVLDQAGNLLGRAAYSPASKIRARMWTFVDEAVDENLLAGRLLRAVEYRRMIGYIQPGRACRVVNAESDGIPGFIADLYDKTMVVQFLSAGAERWRDVLIALLRDILLVEWVYERSDVEVRRLEELDLRAGQLAGDQIINPLRIQEGSHTFLVDIIQGHKTGFYLDQRVNRGKFEEILGSTGRGGSLLNCFCYSGAFTVYGLAGGMEQVVSIDSSQNALDLAGKNLEMNGYTPESYEWIAGDVFQELRTMRDRGRSFDAILLDPPKFAATVAQVERASRAYKDINLLAFKLLKPGGFIFTFSCSGGVSADLFQKIVAGAAVDAGVDARIVERMGQSPDHPVSLHFPEGSYLKGLTCQVY